MPVAMAADRLALAAAVGVESLPWLGSVAAPAAVSRARGADSSPALLRVVALGAAGPDGAN